MRGLFYRRHFSRKLLPVSIMMVRDRPTVFPVAQVIAKLKGGKKKIWMFRNIEDAHSVALRIVYVTMDVEESESFKLSCFIVRQRARSVRYGIELVRGRILCDKCQCDMQYEVFGKPRCKYHYRAKADAAPCPTCQPKAPISNSKRKRLARGTQKVKAGTDAQGQAVQVKEEGVQARDGGQAQEVQGEEGKGRAGVEAKEA